MAETTLEKATCENCGADVRENTQFCYNCGKSFAEAVHESNGSEPIPMPDNAKSALDDLARKFTDDDLEKDRLAQAAAERKKARVSPRKPKETVWEEVDARSGWLFFLISLMIFALVAAVVFITVYWK